MLVPTVVTEYLLQLKWVKTYFGSWLRSTVLWLHHCRHEAKLNIKETLGRVLPSWWKEDWVGDKIYPVPGHSSSVQLPTNRPDGLSIQLWNQWINPMSPPYDPIILQQYHLLRNLQPSVLWGHISYPNPNTIKYTNYNNLPQGSHKVPLRTLKSMSFLDPGANTAHMETMATLGLGLLSG